MGNLGAWQPPPDPVLAAVGVCAGHPDVPRVLDRVSVAVGRGRRVAVLGANGSGKTTLLRVLSGAHVPDDGFVMCAGTRLRHDRSGLRDHRRRVQLVLQDPDDQLFSADVRQDVSFGPLNLGLSERRVRGRVERTLELLGITELAERPVHHLSFGQRKRVAIAGALAMHPQILLLDEPTAGLDPVGVREMLAALADLERDGTTVVIATHDVDLAWRWADEVVLVVDRAVSQGRVELTLTDQELLAHARLRPPWVVELLGRLGVAMDGRCPPRTTADVARLLSGSTGFGSADTRHTSESCAIPRDQQSIPRDQQS